MPVPEGQLTTERIDEIRKNVATSNAQVAYLANAESGLSETPERKHFSMWAMLGAALLAGNEVRTMNDQTRAILTNRDVIAVDQDLLAAGPMSLPPRTSEYSSSRCPTVRWRSLCTSPPTTRRPRSPLSLPPWASRRLRATPLGICGHTHRRNAPARSSLRP
jgi:Alpha galactosidase A